jgi:acid phosphatase family membrane protein YuiD
MIGFYALLSFVLGWFLAQIAKVIRIWITEKSLVIALKRSAESGGMPSGHTASMVAMTMYFWWETGLSEIFALSFGVMSIIIYDAGNTRFSVGQIAEYLNGKIREKKSAEKELKVARGHTVAEIFFGAILGILIGTGIFLLTNG